MSTVVSWNLRVSVRGNKLDDFEALMKEMVESTWLEAGTLAYEWFISEDNAECHIYERYADSGAVMAHLANFGAKFSTRFLDCVNPTGFCVYGEPNEEVQKALDGLGGKYLKNFGGFIR